jgi:phosphoenolpyruvate-protein phosphotransferase (PTS system enzyme I)
VTVVLDGSPASDGIASGKVFHLEWGMPIVPHETIPLERTDEELERFHAARAWARDRLYQLKVSTEERLGAVEARIFEPQILMLDDTEVVDGTVRYICENRLSAARAFEWRMLELQAMWSRTSQPDGARSPERPRGSRHPRPASAARSSRSDGPCPARGGRDRRSVEPDAEPDRPPRPENVFGIATDLGTRTAHWAILARSLEIPAVVSLGDVTKKAQEGQKAIIDGRIGRIVLDPGPEEREQFASRRRRFTMWEEDIRKIAGLESVTADGQYVELRANLDLPSEAPQALGTAR